MTLPKRAAILTGGTSLERDIAFKSATLFEKFSPVPCDTFDFPSQAGAFLARREEYGFVFPVFHGEWGEDGLVTAFLKVLGIPCAFSPFATHALCLDKTWANKVVENLPGVFVPTSRLYASHTSAASLNLSLPVIIKPNRGGSSFATTKVKQSSDLFAAFEEVFTKAKDAAIVQEFIAGEEYSVPVIGTKNAPEVLPILHIKPIKSDFFDYEEKYLSDGSNEVFGDLSADLNRTLTDAAMAIWYATGCSGVARIDFRVRDNKPYFLEVNTIPGFTEASIFPKAWKLTGRDIPQLVTRIMEIGLTDQ